MNGQTMNIFEFFGWGLLFFVGFTTGYLISQTSGFLPGVLIGFTCWLLALFLVNRVRLKIGKRSG